MVCSYCCFAAAAAAALEMMQNKEEKRETMTMFDDINNSFFCLSLEGFDEWMNDKKRKCSI